MPYTGRTVPDPVKYPGWLLCDGSEIDQTTYQELFTLIGFDYKQANLISDGGVAKFALPDLRGRMPIGAGQSPYSFINLGDKQGLENLNITQL